VFKKAAKDPHIYFNLSSVIKAEEDKSSYLNEKKKNYIISISIKNPTDQQKNFAKYKKRINSNKLE
jgi:hypothetical protein